MAFTTIALCCYSIAFFNLFLIVEPMISKEQMLKMLEKQEQKSGGSSSSGSKKKVASKELFALSQSLPTKKKVSSADLGRMLKSFSMGKSSGGSSSSDDTEMDKIMLNGIRKQILNFNAPKASGVGRCPCGHDTLIRMDDVFTGGDGFYKKTREQIASGSQGKIYHGYSIFDNKCIVIKELSLVNIDEYTQKNCDMEFLASNVVKKCYEDDAVGMMRIVRIFEVTRTAHKISIFMEKGIMSAEAYWKKILENDTLNSIVSGVRQYAMKLELATELVMKIVKAFISLHSVGIMHLDFKLANAMLFPDEKDSKNYLLKLIDLGAARTTSSYKSLEAINSAVVNRFAVMTFEHCAPEQTTIKKDPVTSTYYVEPTSKSDIWGIGSAIMFMLSGQYTSVWFKKNDGENAEGMAKMAIWLATKDEYGHGPLNLQNGALYQLALACLHVKPNERPMAYQMLAYLSNWCTMPVANIYKTILGISSRTFSGVTGKDNIVSCFQLSPEEYVERSKRGSSRISSIGGFSFAKMFS